MWPFMPTTPRPSRWLAAAGLVGIAAASCGEKSATAVVLAVSATDLVPMTIDRVTVRAGRASGAPALNRTYVVGKDATLPGTLTLAPGDGDGTVEVRVEGRLGEAPPRVSRVARFGFVEEKVKVLRIDLERSCVDVPCSEDRTCVHGECVKPDIDSSQLPDFVSNEEATKPLPTAGNGGASGAGNGGAGMAGASGSGAGGAGAGGAGAGGAGAGGAGASGAGAGGAGAGGAGAAGAGAGGAPVYACSHAACVVGPTLSPACDPCATIVCGLMPSCCTTTWDLACANQAQMLCGLACNAETIADAQGSVKELAADGKDVFWTRDLTGSGNTELVRASRDALGGAVVPLDTATGMFALTVSPTEVFYRTAAEWRRVPKMGGVPVPFATTLTPGGGLFHDGTNLYFCDGNLYYGPDTNLASPKSFAATRCSTVTYDPSGGYAYWTDRPLGQTNFVNRASVPDGVVEQLAQYPMPAMSSANAVVVDGATLYLADGLAGTVQQCPKTDCSAPQTLWSLATANPQRIAFSGTKLYWTIHDVGTAANSGGVAMCDVSDCPNTVVIYGGQDRAQGLAVDDTYVYWATQGTSGAPTTGLIRRAPK